MKKGGFTLVELIAVIIILGILAAIGIPQYRRAMERARGAEAYAGMGQVAQAEKIRYVEAQNYYTNKSPLSNADEAKLDIALPQKDWSFSVTSTDENIDFTITANRIFGPCAGKTITVDQAGSSNDAWSLCVSNL